MDLITTGLIIEAVIALVLIFIGGMAAGGIITALLMRKNTDQ
jgi:hypothetical protein